MSSEEHGPVGIDVDTVASAACTKCGVTVDVSALKPFIRAVCPSCGETFTVPARLGPFLLLGQLGAGGMGTVYEAKDETLGRFVAIKVMQSSVSEDVEFVETFKREAQAAAKLNHPNVAQIYSFGQEKGQHYIVMELVRGDGLDKLIDLGEPIDQALLMQIAYDISSGLSAAAEAGLTHGDIKPENILLDDKMHAKLVDFGIATLAQQTGDHGIWGTPYYIAPEKIRRQRIDQRADIYSLGATLYHALTGHPPFEGETPIEVVKARLEQAPAPMSELRRDINPHIEQIIGRMLQLEPGMRYPNYVSLMNDIRKVLDAMGPPAVARAKGKKIMIKKKGGKTILTSPSVSSSGPEPSQSGKFVVRKTGGASAFATSKPAEAPAPAEPSAPRSRKGVKAALIVVLLLALGVGGALAALFVKRKHDAQLAARREQYVFGQSRRNAAESFGAIRLVVSNIVSTVQVADGYIAKAAEAATFVVGEEFIVPAPEVDLEPVAAEAPAADSAVTNVAVETGAAETNAQPANAAGETATGGESAEASAGEEVAAVTTIVEEPPAPVDEPEVVTLARKVVMLVRELDGRMKEATTIEAQAEVTKQAVDDTKDALLVKGHVSVLQGHLDSVNEIQKGVRNALADADKALVRIEEIRAREARLREERLLREEVDAKRQAEEAARQHEEEQRQARITTELAAVETIRGELKEFLVKNEFRLAAGRVNARKDQFQTDEGKKAIRTLEDRYERLSAMKEYLIKRLNEAPMKWGLGRGSTARDIVGANAVTIRAVGASLPWIEVDAAQMAKFFKAYLSGRDVKLVVLGEQNLAAAIYCYENGFEDAARVYVNKAIEYIPNLQEDVKRLVPLD